MVLLAMFDGALCVPLLAFAAISKYQVPAASPAIVYVVAVGLVIAIEEHYQLQSHWHWAMMSAAVFAVPLAATGVLFLLIAKLMFTHRARKAIGISE